MSEFARWLGFGVGVVLAIGTVVAVMKTLIVPRRSWSFLAATVGRLGYRVFYGMAARLRSFDHADRLLGFEAPTVIILTLSSLLGSFTLAFGLMLLPWAGTVGDALRESGSSVFTLGFVSTATPVPTALDVTAGATGMIFVALTIGYLPSLYAEVRVREALVKQLEVWTGKPSWGPEILARFALVGGLDRLPALYDEWSAWSARVADSHMKYPVLTHFRGPRSHNHFVVALLAVSDAAALEIAARPDGDHTEAQLLLRQAVSCLHDVAYPMRRIPQDLERVDLDRADFRAGWQRLLAAGYPVEADADTAWETFASIRTHYAAIADRLLYWTIAAPAPWSGERRGFPGLTDRPDSPEVWTLV
ncbi:MAG: hypothetical protein QNJ12_19420 [Ilumatobacter sp.]|uniref:hypothetical protein n=1 Tax=Ilumatobacter sp. TaxID=1967498 RepID=UPI002636DC2E|nr:hypothetical protein [Ilumatobacter sp.]MDJ0770972.1 hypothetical protein [Ilumatobacter sp.]